MSEIVNVFGIQYGYRLVKDRECVSQYIGTGLYVIMTL